MTIEQAVTAAGLGKVISKETVDFLYKWNVDISLISKLETMLLIFYHRLEHAELKQVNNRPFRKLLQKVNVAIYDTEDLLDEIATDALKSVNKERGFLGDVLDVSDSIKSGFDSKGKEVASALNPFKETIETRMRNVLEKLESLINGMGHFGSEKIKKKVDYGTVFVSTEIYGRNLDKMEIIKSLKAGEKDKQVGVVPIVGMGDVGKTTLAKMVYDSNELKFSLKAWARVTDSCDVERITKALIESTGNVCNFDDLDLLQNKLKNILQGKKFLLVLDDMWNETYKNWEVLKIPFSVGEPGSQVIVTTRDREVGNIGTVPIYNLEVLSADDCWSVIEAIAFQNRDSAEFPALKEIGKKISRRCKGLPLAAKTLGGLLRLKSLDEMQWTFILNSELWDLPHDNNIIPSLLVSYDHLPMEVKKCFVYCAVFPKGYRFEMEELVLLWMAEGLLPKPENESNQMEDVGRTYFYLLRTQSILQPRGSTETEFVMHDLIHDLAQFFSGEIFLHLEGNVSKHRAHEQCRRISHFCRADEVSAKFEQVTSLEHLRTFLTLRPYLRSEFHYLSSDVLSVLTKFKKMRVLSLSGYLIHWLPESIGCLKYLRYLNLSHSLIECLPDAIKILYNLQTLILVECHHLTRLNDDFGSLTKLRHIDTAGTSLKEMPLRMGNLTCLQSLSDFVIGNGVGSKISQLENLAFLRGKLCISGLKNIANSKDARDAVLSNKIYLDELILEWSSEDSKNHILEERVFHELKPHVNLKILEIRNFRGSEFPPWIGDSSFGSLVSICIDRCRHCETLPSVGQLPSLKKLVLKELDEVKEIGDDLWGNCDSNKPFPSLQILVLQDMKNLTVWTSLGQNKMFNRLEKLQILDCPKLFNFTYCFPSLRELWIERCGELTGIWKPYTEASLLDDYKFLRSVRLIGCPKLEEIPRNIFELEMLYLDGCNPTLTEIPEDIAELKMLPLEDCELGLSKLQKLFIYDSEMKLIRSVTHQTSQEVTRRSTNLRALESLCTVSVFFTWQLSQLRKLFGYDSQMDIISRTDLRFCALKLLELTNVRLLDKLPATFIQKCQKLEELKIFYCPDLVSLANSQEEEISGFPFLRSMTIKGCVVLKEMPLEMVKFAPFIESLYVEDCQSLAKLPSDLSKLDSLQNLAIIKCKTLMAYPDSGLPASLKRLTVRECNSLETFEDQMLRKCSSLELIEIERCSELVSVCENGDLPLTLKHLKIRFCRKLSSLPRGLSMNQSLNLIILEISDCSLVTRFQSGELPPTLQRLVISGCDSLISLPEGIHKLTYLQSLEISECPLIEQFPNRGLPNSALKSLVIKYCQNLKSLPVGIHNLGSLDELEITGCPTLKHEYRLPYNLKRLLIKDCEELQLHPLQLDTLAHLLYLSIHNILGPVIFTEENPLPYSIIQLSLIGLPGLVSLPETLDKSDRHSKLQHLFIHGCHNLKQMPKNGLPDTVAFLRITDCPQITLSCKQDKGTYWPKIKMIPNAEIK